MNEGAEEGRGRGWVEEGEPSFSEPWDFLARALLTPLLPPPIQYISFSQFLRGR